jgi:hypothetical protein
VPEAGAALASIMQELKNPRAHAPCDRPVPAGHPEIRFATPIVNEGWPGNPPDGCRKTCIDELDG